MVLPGDVVLLLKVIFCAMKIRLCVPEASPMRREGRWETDRGFLRLVDIGKCGGKPLGVERYNQTGHFYIAFLHFHISIFL